MKSFKGAYTALITPFTQDGQLDEEGLRHLLHRQIEETIDGIVLLGTTGETPTLAGPEKKRILQIAAEICKGKTSFIVGTGTYSTRETIENTLSAEKAGADAVLIVTPYYNKPTQEGLYLHFKTIAETSALPVIIYNIEGRSCLNLETDTLKRLLDIPSIVGIKESSGNISQISDVIGLVRARRPEFNVLSGDDTLTLPLMALGGDGIISVISNLMPAEVKSLVEAISSGDFALAREIHFKLMPFIKLAFLETNPIPIKQLLQLYGLPSGQCRLPLSQLKEENIKQIKSLIYFS